MEAAGQRADLGTLALTLLVRSPPCSSPGRSRCPIGIYSAVRSSTRIGDYIVTFLGFIGMAMPNFLLALVLMYVVGRAISARPSAGCSRPISSMRPGAWAKVGDLLHHLWIPVIVLARRRHRRLIRIMRANLLDELHKPYVETARAKGLPEFAPDAEAIRSASRSTPSSRTIGWVLPDAGLGAVIVSPSCSACRPPGRS